MPSDNTLKTRRWAVTAKTAIKSSFAVDQVRGMFDLKKESAAAVSFNVDLPTAAGEWQIGVIVGPSGSGKSTVARKAYGSAFVAGSEWSHSKSVVDHFPEKSIKDVAQMLTAVGFSSPPAWIKPYHVLSGGERFRCDLARALLMSDGLVAFDEFTSVVDRTVAKIGSAAIAKSIRKGFIATKFVAVTCHYDVLEWLEPDWILDMASGQLARGSLRRPQITLSIAPIHRGAWDLFKRHHYLNTSISNGAKCFAAFWGETPVAFSSWVPRITRGKVRNAIREHRTVVLPDFQGVGIGNRVSEFCAAAWRAVGKVPFSTTSHPSMIHYRSRSPLWRVERCGMVGRVGRSGSFVSCSAGRVTAGFRYVGPALDADIARRLIDGLSNVRPIGSNVDAVLSSIDRAAMSRAAIARATGLSLANVESALSKLQKSSLVVSVRVGKRRAFARA